MRSIAAVCISILVMTGSVYGAETVTMLFTSNLEGRFSTVIDNQEEEDRMLLLAQSLAAAGKKHNAIAYIDLGNGFYPGTLSRYSFGSVMMDFFNYFNCDATLISSQDLNIGIKNLEFLKKGRDTSLLSANIMEKKNPLFTPYIIRKQGNKTIGLVGLTSTRGVFDIAERKLYSVDIRPYRKRLDALLPKLKEECDYIILLSGLSYRENLSLLSEVEELDLVVSGGDASGSLFSSRARRVDLENGKSVLTLTGSDGYYTLTLTADGGLRVRELAFTSASRNRVDSRRYNEFVNRLTLWKKKFQHEGAGVVASKLSGSVLLDDHTVAHLLRHVTRSEVAMLVKHSVVKANLEGKVTYSDIVTSVNNEYPVLTYRVRGSLLKRLVSQTEMVVSGARDGRVQGNPIRDDREYSVCSTQKGYERLLQLTGGNVAYTNTWKTLSDLIRADLHGEGVLARGEYQYLDNRFRLMVDVSLSNFYDRSVVSRGDEIETPPGKPEETYRKWGLENKIDFTIYNRYHTFVLTPYVYYMRQDREYLNNLFRGTFLYTYNLGDVLKPYHKSQGDTVLVETENSRPVLMRETVGAFLSFKYLDGKLGAGFEKQVQNPENKALYGVEAIIDLEYPFWDRFNYTFLVDMFLSTRDRDFVERHFRSDVTTGLSYSFNRLLSLSAKYRWFYLYSIDYDQEYRNSQFLLSLDVNADFKFF